MPEPVTLDLVVAIIVILGAAGTLWWRIETRHNRLDDKIAENSKALSAHKLHAAETFMTKQGAGEAIEKMLVEIRGLRADMKDMIHSLDERLREMEKSMANNRAGKT